MRTEIKGPTLLKEARRYIEKIHEQTSDATHDRCHLGQKIQLGFCEFVKLSPYYKFNG